MRAELTPKIGALSLFSLGVNGIVGVGIFFTPNLIAALVPGAAGALVYLTTAALLLPIAVTFSLLGRAVGLDGGPYVWARSAFGDGLGFLVGWLTVVSALLSTAAVFSGIREHLGPLLAIPPGLFQSLFAVALLAGLLGVAALGLRPSAFAWDFLTALKLVPLLLLIVLAYTLPAASVAASPQPTDFRRALLVAVFPLQGFEVVPVLAGSVRHGRLGVPFATCGSLLFAALLYAAIQLGCVRALPDLSAQTMPLVATAHALGGALVAGVVAFGTNLSALGTAFGMVVMTPRYLAALGTPAALGGWLGEFDARGVPRRALLLTASLVALLASSEALVSLLALASAAVLVQYSIAIAALVRLALARRFELGRAALIPALLGFFAIVLLVAAIEPSELNLLAAALGLGVVFELGRRYRLRRRIA
jgi:APA family basic amino acid/polyamine antiporter